MYENANIGDGKGELDNQEHVKEDGVKRFYLPLLELSINNGCIAIGKYRDRTILYIGRKFEV